MDELVERTRQEIRRQGYKTETRISIELSKKYDEKTIKKVLSLLECEDIKKVKYSNTYLANFTMKDMYCYDPRKPKRKRRSKKKS